MINTFSVTLEEVVFEGLIYEDPEPNLFLLAPKESHGDPTNLYSMSTGYMEKVASMCGFELVDIKTPKETRVPNFLRKKRPRFDRAAMRFRRVADEVPGYEATCFSVAPRALKG